ncbi:hypothetical protein ABT120_45845 [Nonomuraea angiospora]|uniref:hypothetical protein n=1 Tax=Nonomuraea angiospora TaxID=46172 RepID=UPI003327272D
MKRGNQKRGSRSPSPERNKKAAGEQSEPIRALVKTKRDALAANRPPPSTLAELMSLRDVSESHLLPFLDMNDLFELAATNSSFCLAQIIDQAKRCCLKAAMALRGVEDEAVLGAAEGTSATPYAWPLLPYLDDQEVVLAYLDIPADETRRDAADTLLAQAVLDPGSRQHIHEAVQAVNAEWTART